VRNVVLVDLDHTLADSYWRDCLMPLDHERGDWTTYYSCQWADRPIPAMLGYVRELAEEHDVWIITARSAKYREDTERWLDRHGVPRVGVLMRPLGDLSKSPELKLRLAAELLPRVRLLIDDRDDVLELFVANGVSVLKSGNGATMVGGGGRE
jgi:hypothetical protein